ncbi:MAG: glycosyltransferase [Bacteroidaceae bacterium]|nr:glycosyltransferase [Bacteroidaceae bacterium]
MKSLNLAPIILFAFNRPDALRNTIESLLQNTEAKDSDLYVFVDGARTHKEGEQNKVKEVQEYVKSITGFNAIKYRFSEANKGLGPSIIKGVTEIINQHGKAIVLEDDLVFSSNFLSFMNQGLNRYEQEKDVFSICGYTNKVKVPYEYKEDAYFCVRSSSWGWATWADRWNTIDWDLKNWTSVKKNKKGFNNWGGSDCFSMLQGWKEGKNQSWAIRFCFSQFIQNKVSLFPIISKVKNDGFDGQGTNCKKWSRFKYVFDNSNNKSFLFPELTSINPTIYKSAVKYHSIPLRLWSKIMYMLHQ